MNSPPSNNHNTVSREELGSPNAISNGTDGNGHLVSIHGEVEGMEINGLMAS